MDSPYSPSSPERAAYRDQRHRNRRPSDVEGGLPSNSRSSRTPRSPPKRSDRGDPAITVTSHDPSPGISPGIEPMDPMISNKFSAHQADLNRKRSLVRPERRRHDPEDPNYFYRKHAQRMEVKPSATGNDPVIEDRREAETVSSESTELRDGMDEKDRVQDPSVHPANRLQKRPTRANTADMVAERRRKQKAQDANQVPTLWTTYCALVTFWAPSSILACFGKPQKPQQRAWREKMGLLSIIALLAAFVGFLTFGFTAAVCPPTNIPRLRINHIGKGYLIVHGQAYDLTRSQHPYARGVPAGANVLYLSTGDPLGGYDGSFMFQNVNGHCKGLIGRTENSLIPTNENGDLGWYQTCNPFKQDGSTEVNYTFPYYFGYSCHTSTNARNAYYGLRAASDVYFTWDDIKNSSRNLAVYGSDVLDLDLIKWMDPAHIQYNSRFDEIRNNPDVRGTDLTLAFTSSEDRQIAKCFSEILKVGTVDTESIGCIASKVVLYVSLIFILSIVAAKFFLALIFQWFLCHKYAAPKGVEKDDKKRQKEIEDWSNDIYRPPPKLEDPFQGALSDRSSRASTFLPNKSRFTSPYAVSGTFSKIRPNPITMSSQPSTARLIPAAPPSYHSGSDLNLPGRNSVMASEKSGLRQSTYSDFDGPGPAGFIHESVVPQPPPEWQPFGYPLAHCICLVTCYSEGEDALRTTLDSVATTDYPNSHKIMFVVCDGLVKGHGEEFTTPDIALSMMKDHTILPDEVQPFSYVAVANGSKRHNMAKIYSGFYDYGEESDIPVERQQRVPMMVIVKCGTPAEAGSAKPGNRGKRDSQIILMSFLQKVMFDERMSELEYEMFNGMWKVTGISPDFFELCLAVDADTKVFPDCMTHMVHAMVKDPEIMGCCGETKIANKRESWVTAIQVFEYFISHHQAKSFESVFGGVTCLPGCFSMYRIKSPKGGQNYWVPVLANPDIVEHYSENVVDTLHRKNLLLLGEDRYLSTLMLRTFPKRKQVFIPQAICKTTVPNTFRVLLSQRRRWINSTIHNLMELILVRDLCGTFCFSMQFVVFIELVGTCVLPAAIAFTFYVIIDSIISGIRHLPIPTIPLILLALILGLPGGLIVLTARNWSYVVWMMIYLIALPIWNGVLPLYAYWKFDDFSWGDTRKTAGDIKTKGGHGDKEGEFDSTKITMKRWAEFEQERRMKENPFTQRSSYLPSNSWQGA